MEKKQIIIIDNSGLSYTGNDINGPILRGTETSLILLSEELIKKNCDVFFANNINSKHVWKCLSLEEDYNLKKWGQDKEAKEKLLEKKSYFNEIINLYLLFKKSEK